jgi:hypothetical protein
LWIEKRQAPFGTPLHVFSLKPGSFQGAGDWCHKSTSRDDWTAKEDGGVTPSHHLVNAWRSVLGDSDVDTRLDEADNCQQDPNTDQTDSDRDGSGNACDLTPLGTPPTIVTPGHITVDATAPAGVVVTYAVTATDDIDADPMVNRVPPSDSVFAIGDKLVACDSTDSLGNTASANFLVTVLGAKEQLANLIRKVVDSTSLPAAVKTQLIASLQSLVAGFDASNPVQHKIACQAEGVHQRCQVPSPARRGGRMDRRREPHQRGARLLSQADSTCRIRPSGSDGRYSRCPVRA